MKKTLRDYHAYFSTIILTIMLSMIAHGEGESISNRYVQKSPNANPAEMDLRFLVTPSDPSGVARKEEQNLTLANAKALIDTTNTNVSADANNSLSLGADGLPFYEDIDLTGVSADAGNSLSVGADGLPFFQDIDIPLSADANNSLVLGADGGFFFEDIDATLTQNSAGDYVWDADGDGTPDLTIPADDDTALAAAVALNTAHAVADADLTADSFASTGGSIANAGTADALDLDVNISADAGNGLLFGTDGGLLVPAPAKSEITAGTDNQTPQVHDDGTGTTVTLDPFDPSTSALTATNQPAAIEELANIDRAWSQDGVQKSNDLPTSLTDSIAQQADVHVNATEADRAAASSDGYSLSVGDSIGSKDDVLIENGRLDHNIPIGVLTATHKTNADKIFRGENNGGDYVHLAYDNTSQTFESHVDVYDNTTWNGTTHSVRYTSPTFIRNAWGNGQNRDGNVIISGRYADRAEAASLPGHRLKVGGLGANAGTSMPNWHITHGGHMTMNNTAPGNGGIDAVWGAYANPNTTTQFGNFNATPTSGAVTGTGAGGYVAFGTNGGAQVVTKLTSHDASLVEILKEHGAIPKERKSEYVSLNISMFPEERKVIVEKGESIYLEGDIVTGEYYGDINGVEFKGKSDHLLNFKSIVNLGFPETEESWSMSNEERVKWASKLKAKAEKKDEEKDSDIKKED